MTQLPDCYYLTGRAAPRQWGCRPYLFGRGHRGARLIRTVGLCRFNFRWGSIPRTVRLTASPRKADSEGARRSVASTEVHQEAAGDEQAASTARFASVAQFVRRHGVQTLDEVLEKLDDYLGQHRPETLDDALRVAPVFGNLLGRSRKQLNHALEGIADEEHTWMILTFNPDFEKRKECFTIRSVIGDCGPITVSFADQIGGRKPR